MAPNSRPIGTPNPDDEDVLGSLIDSLIDRPTRMETSATALMARYMTEERLPAAQVVFEEHAPGDAFYVIKRGRVQVSRTLDTGREHVLADLGRGEMFGEMALLENKPRTARVTTLMPTVLLTMSRQTFETLIEQHPEIAVHFFNVISARLGQRDHEQGSLIDEKQALVETLSAKNTEIEGALQELQTLRETETRLTEALQTQHTELQDAYRQMEASNTRLQTLLKLMQVVRIGAMILIVGLFLGLGLYTWNPTASLRLLKVGASSQETPVVPNVETMTVTPQRLASTISLLGHLEPLRVVNVVSPIDGRVVIT